MAKWKFSTKGVREAKKALDEIANEIGSGPITPDVLFKVAVATKDLAASRTPVRTGELKAGNQAEQVDRKTARVFNPVPYGPHVNNGTSRMVARPFFTSAVLYAKRRLPQLFSAEMRKKIAELISKNKPR